MIYTAGDNIISSLGFTTEENVRKIREGICGIRINHDQSLSPSPVYISIVDTERLNLRFAGLHAARTYTRLEKLSLLSITNALENSPVDIKNEKTGMIFSTTKGNIDLLDKRIAGEFEDHRIDLWAAGREIQEYFENPNTPIIISHACVSGLLAIIVAMRLLNAGKYESIVVTGTDIMSEFVISGFHSFQAISPEPCKPFDRDRSGITIGEGCGTIILTSNRNLSKKDQPVLIKGGVSTNDANHISGPSRSGDGLYYAIRQTLSETGIPAGSIDYISAHGTGTDYNDEMEAKALAWAGLEDKPVNSFKGYIGHTLGAAGIIESVLGIESLVGEVLFPSMGFENPGVSKELNVIRKIKPAPLKNCLKLASGFGGSNAAVIYQKVETDYMNP